MKTLKSMNICKSISVFIAARMGGSLAAIVIFINLSFLKWESHVAEDFCQIELSRNLIQKYV